VVIVELPPFFQEKFSFLDKLPFKINTWITSGAATLAGIGLFVFYFQKEASALKYAQTEILFAKWETSPQNERFFEDMKKALHKIPALEQKYQPLIVQKLIETGKGLEAIEMARQSLKVMAQEAPFHASFAETTLLIESGNYQQALEKSVGLKGKIEREYDVAQFMGDHLVDSSLLYAHNLLRIACLHQALKNNPGELAAWEVLEMFLGKENKSAVGALVLSNFQEKGVNLFDYIAERKRNLSF
jgi:hypothetical protein